MKRIIMTIFVLIFAILWTACDQTTSDPTQPAQNDAPAQIFTPSPEAKATLDALRANMPNSLAEVKSLIKTRLQSPEARQNRKAQVSEAARSKLAEWQSRYPMTAQDSRKDGGSLVTETVHVYVPDDYATIQEAVDAAAPGDTIVVRNGEYSEGVYITTDNITLMAENNFGVALFGGGVFDGVTGGELSGIVCIGDIENNLFSS